MYSLSSCAINFIKLITYSGLPLNLFLSSGFWVAIPTGHVSKLQTLIITHPIVTSGAVAKPNSSAPRSAATNTSLPLISLPSVSIITLSLKLFWINVWWVSAIPSSQGSPALWIEFLGAAPVPPSYPDTSITWAPAFATPAATVPTPDSDTSFTDILASLLAFLQSYINCAKSSIEYISWCGGGEINETPGVECLVFAIHGYTFLAGKCPPSPGFAPCAIFIWISCALVKYLDVTPNLPDAICLIAEHLLRPSLPIDNLSRSSPPSPLFDLPWIVFIAIANVSWASLEIDPYDIAPVLNLLTIESTLSTCSIGIPFLGYLKSSKPLKFIVLVSLFINFVYSLNNS